MRQSVIFIYVLLFGNPYFHHTRAAVVPGIIGDERMGLVGETDEAAQRLVAAGLELALGIELHVVEVKVVIGPLGAVHYRAAFYGNHAAVGLYGVVSLYDARIHGKLYINLVALLPVACNGEIALVEGRFHFLAVEFHGVRLVFHGVGICVEVARHGITLSPAGIRIFIEKLPGLLSTLIVTFPSQV